MLTKWFTCVLCAAALMGCDSPRSQLDAHELAIAAKQLASIAAEGELLARQLESHRVSREFAWVHQQALGDEAQQVAQQLQRLAPAALRARQQELLLLQARFQQGVLLVADVRGQPAELARLAQQFHEIAAAATAVRPA